MEKISYLVGGKKITAYIPKRTSYEALENLYDCCNEIFSEYEECFYTSNEVLELKKDSSNVFLRKG